MRASLLVVDLDDTLLGDAAALASFREWYAMRRQRLELIYASGRFYESMMRSIRQAPLPAPKALICGVGTDVRDFDSGRSVPGWQERLRVGWSAERVREVCAAFRELTPQPEEFQSELKVSYFGRRLSPRRRLWIEAALRSACLKVTVIYSGGCDVDILPAGADKGAAAAYLLNQLPSQERCVLAAGNSLNDLALFRQGFLGITVANADVRLKRLAKPPVYHSGFSFARGVLDGLCHWLDEPAGGHLGAAASDSRPAPRIPPASER